jgi:hypothetical protein
VRRCPEVAMFITFMNDSDQGDVPGEVAAVLNAKEDGASSGPWLHVATLKVAMKSTSEKKKPELKWGMLFFNTSKQALLDMAWMDPFTSQSYADKRQ